MSESETMFSDDPLVRRVGAVRNLCHSAINLDDQGSELARAALKILDGSIDEQLAEFAPSKPLQFIGHDPDTVERLEADAARLRRVTAVDDDADRVVSKYQPLVDRAEELAGQVASTVSGCWEHGPHPRLQSVNLLVFNELASLVRDLARAVAER